MSENFIEIWHEDDEFRENWFATKTITHWKDGTRVLGGNSWQINGTTLYLHDSGDVEAVRKLIDAVEERILEERN